jgi:hypothetical protein
MSSKERDESFASQEQRSPEKTQGKSGAEEKERAADKQPSAETGPQVEEPDAWDPERVMRTINSLRDEGKIPSTMTAEDFYGQRKV